jgi:carboxypeptidase Taq
MANGTQDIYRDVMGRYRELHTIGTINGFLQWDQQVNMPPKGIVRRSEQLALLDGLSHRKLTDPAMVAGVATLHERRKELDEDGRVNARELKREVDRATKVPVALVEEMSRHDSLAQQAWVQARQADDFAAFAPYIEKTVDLRKQEAAALGFVDKPYDALLDNFEPGATEEKVTALLADLRERLVPFFHRILGAPKFDPTPLQGKTYPVAVQRDFVRKVIARLGFDFEGGRQDLAPHPFCSGYLGDVRITTRFFENDPRPGLAATLHEMGHALYEQGLPAENVGTPLGESVSLGVHESQSRFWENEIGRGLPFWKHLLPELKAAYAPQLDGLTLEQMHRLMNVVAPSLIRVEADEVSYNLHIILRFEIEAGLMSGAIAIADLPGVWNAKMKEYLNIEVPNNAAGVLQDIHWSLGALGYFPTYTIGNLYAAQLWEKIRADLPDMDAGIERGEFAPILDWLRTNIHRHGKRFAGDELIERVTGKKPSAEPFMAYLNERFGSLYGV